MTDYGLDLILAAFPFNAGKAPLVWFASWGRIIVRRGDIDTTNTYL